MSRNISQDARKLAYQIAMRALNDERKVRHITPTEFAMRAQEIWLSCFSGKPNDLLYQLLKKAELAARK